MTIYDTSGSSGLWDLYARAEAWADELKHDAHQAVQPIQQDFVAFKQEIQPFIDDVDAFSETFLPGNREMAAGYSGGLPNGKTLAVVGLVVVGFAAYTFEHRFLREEHVPLNLPAFPEPPSPRDPAPATTVQPAERITPVAGDDQGGKRRLEEVEEEYRRALTSPMRRGETDSDRAGWIHELDKERKRLGGIGKN